MAAAGVTIWVSMFFIAGPPLEARFNPPVEVQIVDGAHVEGDRLEFFVLGTKHRQCTVDSLTSSWVMDDNETMPTRLYYVGEPVGEVSTYYAAGDSYHSGPFQVDVPENVPLGANLRLLWTYHCHSLWDLQVKAKLSLSEVLNIETSSPRG